MAIDVPRFTCSTCGAAWSEGRWTWGCKECSGAAMALPCEQCGGGCGAVHHRAVMDSHDSRTGHFVGACAAPGDLREKYERWQQLEQAARALAPPWVQLRAALAGWSSDLAWTAEPFGPPVLRVLSDGLKERGFAHTARALAHAVFGWGAPDGTGLRRLGLERYWHSAGALVVLEVLPGAPWPSRPKPTRLAAVHQVLSTGPSWLAHGREEEIPVAGADALEPGRRALGVLIPVNMVPGLLLAEWLDLPPDQEAALVDLHRHLLAQGEPGRR